MIKKLFGWIVKKILGDKIERAILIAIALIVIAMIIGYQCRATIP